MSVISGQADLGRVEAGDRPTTLRVPTTGMIIWDVGAWGVALFVASVLRYELDPRQIDLVFLLELIAVATVAQVVVGGLLGIYRGRYSIGSLDEGVIVAGSMASAGVAITIVNLLLDPLFAPRSVPLIAVPIVVLIAVTVRVGVRLRYERSTRPDEWTSRRVIIYGAEGEGERLLRSMRSDGRAGYLPVALLDDDPRLRTRRIAGVSVLGTHVDVASAAVRCRADLLVISRWGLDQSLLLELSRAAAEAGLEVRLALPMTEALQPLPGSQAPRVRPVGPDAVGRRSLSVVAVSRGKRLVDITVGVLALLLSLPVLVSIAVVVRVMSGRTIYRAQRVGQYGRTFTMFKFVTMVASDDGPRVTRSSDPRITRLGHWLRKSKLNELPQIINVIRGDMSLVGPRPEDPRYVTFYSERQRKVLEARPGMTSLAFLEFGDEQSFIERAAPADIEGYYLTQLLPEKLEIELRYVSGWTMVGDFRILARTFVELVS